MFPVILVNTLVTVASIEMVFSPLSSEEIISPKPRPEVLSAYTSPSPTPTPTSFPSPTPTHIEYVTESGDTIRKIAKEQYGSELYWTTIWNDNDILTDAAMIHPGLKIKIRTSKPTDTEELARNMPTETPTPTLTPQKEETITFPSITASVTPSPTSAPQTGTQTGSPIGNFANVYLEAGNKYGIPWQILYAMHKVESGLRDGPVDSGGGPQGPLQFLPATWSSYGVDGNGDGNVDINSAPDAIHAAANYLSKHGSIESGLNSYGRIKDDVYNIARSLGYNP